MIPRRLLLLGSVLVVSGLCLHSCLPSQQRDEPLIGGTTLDGIRKLERYATFLDAIRKQPGGVPEFMRDPRPFTIHTDGVIRFSGDWPEGIFDLVPPSYWLTPDHPLPPLPRPGH